MYVGAMRMVLSRLQTEKDYKQWLQQYFRAYQEGGSLFASLTLDGPLGRPWWGNGQQRPHGSQG